MIDKFTLTTIQYYQSKDCCYQMSNSESSNPPPKQRHNKKKLKRVDSAEAKAMPQLTNIEYPEHLHSVNYLSMDSLESTLEDEVTHKTYHEVIMENQHLFQGKIVLHITEGINCLYSIFAAKAQAHKVYCVLNGNSEKQQQNMYMMRQVISENNLQNIIEVLPWEEFNAEIDVIIAEPMGYCLHFDGLIDRVIQARDLFLVKEGKIFPNILSYKCGVLHDEHFSDHKVNFWNDVYGIPMASMKQWISHEPIIRVVDPAMIVSKATKFLTFDLQKISYQQIIKLEKSVTIDLLGPCKGNGLVFWFQAFFTHCLQKKDIKASPWFESTKFTHVTLYWPELLQYQGGQLKIKMKGEKNPKEGYSIITVHVDNNVYQYSFS